MKNAIIIGLFAYAATQQPQPVAVAGVPVPTTAVAVAAPNLTPCQRCCQPGGDCSVAYKGTPGKCCGAVGGQAFCCPGVAAAGAKCYNCGDSYRCYTGFAARNICGGAPVPSVRQRLPPPRYRDGYGYAQQSQQEFTWILILMAVGCVFAVIFCARSKPDVGYAQPGQMVLEVPCRTAVGKYVGAVDRPADLHGFDRVRLDCSLYP